MDKQFVVVALLVSILLLIAIVVTHKPYYECSGVLRTPTDDVITNVTVSLNVFPYDTVHVDAFGAFVFSNIPVNVGIEAVLTVRKDSQVVWKQKVYADKFNRIIVY